MSEGNETFVNEEAAHAGEEFVLNPPEDEPGPDSWIEPHIDIPWFEKVLDFIFNAARKLTGR